MNLTYTLKFVPLDTIDRDIHYTVECFFPLFPLHIGGTLQERIDKCIDARCTQTEQKGN